MKKHWRSAVMLVAALVVLAGCAKKEEQTTNQPEQAPAAATKTAPRAGERAARPSSGAAPETRAAVTIPAETELTVRTITSLSSKDSESGSTWEGTLEQPVTVGDKEVIPKGADVTGKVVNAVPSGRLKQRAELSVALASIKVRGRSYAISTSSVTQQEGSKTTRDVVLIGGGAGVGAGIGAAAGGGKGAAIGGLIGAAAGTAGAMATGHRDVKFPPESVLRFRLTQELKL